MIFNLQKQSSEKHFQKSVTEVPSWRLKTISLFQFFSKQFWLCFASQFCRFGKCRIHLEVMSDLMPICIDKSIQ